MTHLSPTLWAWFARLSGSMEMSSPFLIFSCCLTSSSEPDLAFFSWLRVHDKRKALDNEMGVPLMRNALGEELTGHELGRSAKLMTAKRNAAEAEAPTEEGGHQGGGD